MNLCFRFSLIALLFAPLPVSADVIQYSLCTLSDGKTMTDAQAWLDDWRELVKRASKQYEIRLLVPHAGTESPGQFYIEGSSPTLTTYADGWEWWYSDEEALKSNEQLGSVAVCGFNSIYMTTD